MDLLLVLPKARTAICIENKIWAGEQQEQIGRYQAKLQERYPGWKNYIVFLSPDGRHASTVDSGSQVPVLLASYRHILALLTRSSEYATDSTGFFLAQVQAHLREDIVGNDAMEKLVFSIYQKYPSAMALLSEHRPTLATNGFHRAFLERVSVWQQAVHPEINITSNVYPERGNAPTQVFLQRPEWAALDAHIILSLWEMDVRPKMFAGIQQARGRKLQRQLGTIFQSELRPVEAGWAWWAFTKDGAHVLDNRDMFGDETLAEATERFQSIFESVNEGLTSIAKAQGGSAAG